MEVLLLESWACFWLGRVRCALQACQALLLPAASSGRESSMPSSINVVFMYSRTSMILGRGLFVELVRESDSFNSASEAVALCDSACESRVSDGASRTDPLLARTCLLCDPLVFLDEAVEEAALFLALSNH